MALTTSWQTFGTYRFEYSGFICEFYIDAKYTTQSLENNTTTMQCRLRSKVIQGQGSGYNYYFRLDYAPSVEGTGLWTIRDETITSTETVITHNADGTKWMGLTADIRINGLGLNASFSGSFPMPKISRYAIVTDATNFTDEENPTISFTNNNLYDLRAKLLVNNTEIYSEDLQGNETSYTYLLTTNQRNQLRQLCTDKNLTVTLSINSISNNTIVYTSSSNVTMSITNATPTFTYTVQESNSKVATFLGSSSANSLIKNVSLLTFTVVPTFYKYASFNDIWIGEFGGTNSQHITESPYTADLPIYDSRDLYISLSDSRGFVSTQYDDQRTLLDYEILKINNYLFKRESQTSSNVILNLNVTYYNSVGGIQNTPVVKWKLDNGSYTTIPSSNYVIDGTNHTLKINNYVLSNVLSYQNTGQFTIYIEDALTTVQDSGTNGHVLKGIATFDVGEHDLQVNGDLIVADINRENPVNVRTRLQGAIYEQGTNSNGTYLKYENGVLICYKTLMGTIDITTSWGSLYTSADLILGDFAHAFISRPTITVSPQTQTGTQFMLTGNGNGGAGDGGHGTATNAGAVCLIRPNSRTGVQYVFDIIAIGKWR